MAVACIYEVEADDMVLWRYWEDCNAGKVGGAYLTWGWAAAGWTARSVVVKEGILYMSAKGIRTINIAQDSFDARSYSPSAAGRKNSPLARKSAGSLSGACRGACGFR